MIKLSNRLSELLNLIPPNCKIMADIGCDHGKLVVAAVTKGLCQKGIGVDISHISLQKAIKYATDMEVKNKIEFIVGDGFLSINDNLDCSVIAGLGGNEIVRILSMPHKSSIYILSPHQDSHILRRYMQDNGYIAEKDYIIRSGNKFYPIIVAKHGKSDYKEEELYLGKNEPPTLEFEERNRKRLEYIENIIKNSRDAKRISNELILEAEALYKWQKSLTL